MRVALDCRAVFPGMGGIGRSTAALARTLPGALEPGDELFLLTGLHPPGPGAIEPVAPRVRVEVVPTGASMVDPVFEQVALPALLRELEADLVHTPCFTTPIAASAQARVATVHDVVFRRHPELVEEGLRAYLDRWTRVSCRLADAVVTVSAFSRHEIEACYGRPPGALAVVPNGVDPCFATLERRPASGPPYLLYVGALEPKKDLKTLLAAFGMLAASEPDLPHELVLAGGKGGQALDLEALLQELGPARARVHALGHVPEPQLLSLYAGAAAFVYLSRYEGFGLPPLEAMAAGVPTVVSNRAALPEVVGVGALVVDTGSAAAVACALAALLRDQGRLAAIAQAGRERARSFRWEEAAGKLVEVYRQALARAQTRLAAQRAARRAPTPEAPLLASAPSAPAAPSAAAAPSAPTGLRPLQVVLNHGGLVAEELATSLRPWGWELRPLMGPGRDPLPGADLLLALPYGDPRGALDALRRARRLGVASAFWNVEDPRYFFDPELGPLVRELAREASATFSTTLQLSAEYRALGVELAYLPCHGRGWFEADPLPEEARTVDLLFLGTLTDERRQRLAALRGHLGPQVSLLVRDDLREPGAVRELVRCARLGLSLGSLTDAPAARGEGLTERLFDYPLAGTPVLCDARRHLATCFAPGEEVFVAEDPREAARLAQALLSDPARREAAMRRARARVLAEHLGRHRLREVLRVLLARDLLPAVRRGEVLLAGGLAA